MAARLLREGAEVDEPAPVSGPKDWGLQTPLYQAAWNGHADLVEMLLANGANPNLGNSIGMTPLHGAAGMGRETTTRQLLADGAEVNAKDMDGRTPLRLARDRGHHELFQLIEDHGGVE